MRISKIILLIIFLFLFVSSFWGIIYPLRSAGIVFGEIDMQYHYGSKSLFLFESCFILLMTILYFVIFSNIDFLKKKFYIKNGKLYRKSIKDE